MIFTRRALQRRLTELRAILDDGTIDSLAHRLNEPGRGRLAAVWEVVVLHGLAKLGTLRNEVPLGSGRRPDVTFDNGSLRFTADITTVSDEGLDNNNPYFELKDLIERAKGKLGLPIGGVDLRIKSASQQSERGVRTMLRLPPRNQLQAFVKDQIIPQLQEQMDAGQSVLRVSIDDAEVGIGVTIDPAKSPYSTAGFAAYDVPGIKDRNPLYNALRAKADQLRGAEGVAGVIVADGDCAALADRQVHRTHVSTPAIVEEFLRQHMSIDFVLLLTIRETLSHRPMAQRAERWVHPMLFVRPGHPMEKQLEGLVPVLLAEFPKPLMMPVNGALRAREPGYDLGHHGGYGMGDRKIRISSRELLEILAGLRMLADNGAKNVKASRSRPRPTNPAQGAFLRKLQQGHLPVAVAVIKSEEDDDWVEFEFGLPDPAVSPFQ